MNQRPAELQGLPFSEESERAVLACLFLDSRLWPAVSSRIGSPAFFLHRHQLLFQVIGALVADDQPVDIRTVQARLEQLEQFDACGGLAYLASLDNDLPDLGRVDAYVEIVADRYARRRLILLGRELLAATTGDVAIAEVVGRVEGEMRRIVTERSPGSCLTLAEAVDPMLEALEAGDRDRFFGFTTGFPALDATIHGLQRGQLVVIGGRASMGKTALALNIADHLALEHAAAVLIVSLEMTPGELALRSLCSRSGVSAERLRSGAMSQGQWGSIIAARRDLGRARVVIESEARRPVEVEAAAVRAREQMARLDLVVLDYLQLMDPDGRPAGDEVRDLARITRALKRLARRLEVPILLLSQLSREPTRRADPRPVLADLRGSGSIEQDADVVVFPFRPEYHWPDDPAHRGKAELIVRKNRNGRLETIHALFDGETTTFRPAPEAPRYPYGAPPPVRSAAHHQHQEDPF